MRFQYAKVPWSETRSPLYSLKTWNYKAYLKSCESVGIAGAKTAASVGVDFDGRPWSR